MIVKRLTLSIVFIALVYFAYAMFADFNKDDIDIIQEESAKEINSASAPLEEKKINNEIEEEIVSPIDSPSERILKKPFGIFVSPQNSPVSPERFSGYHTAVDFEAFSKEENIDVKINSICFGEILAKRDASGYGGVLVQSCELEGKPVTIVYGHLRLESVEKNVGNILEKGEYVGVLGKGFSSETDGERKHLHLGIHKGSEINLLGYAQSKNDLSDWINACAYICE